MTAQHTKLRLVAEDEYWSASHSGLGTSAYQVIKAEDGAVLALAVGHDPDAFADPNLDHARRLVACWNACEGTDTKYLEGDDSLPHYTRRLMTQRDDLLEALQAAVECGMVPISSVSEGGASKHSRQVQVADMIRAAIQKATKEQV
jgi:hypothetical protein